MQLILATSVASGNAAAAAAAAAGGDAAAAGGKDLTLLWANPFYLVSVISSQYFVFTSLDIPPIA